MKSGLTVLMMVKNEEFFIEKAIKAVLEVASEVIVFDTGSTDSTIDIVEKIKSRKVRLFEKGNSNPKRLVKLRNEMASMVKTEWFFIVDGDELIEFREPNALLASLEELPGNVLRVEVTMRDYVNDANLVARDRVSGKIWRMGKIEFLGEYPFEGGFPKGKKGEALESFSSGALAHEIVCHHMVFFQRSSLDKDVRVGRHWRKMPFPVLPYFGFRPLGVPKGNALVSAVKLVAYNLAGFFHLFFHRKEQKRDAASRK